MAKKRRCQSSLGSQILLQNYGSLSHSSTVFPPTVFYPSPSSMSRILFIYTVVFERMLLGQDRVYIGHAPVCQLKFNKLLRSSTSFDRFRPFADA